MEYGVRTPAQAPSLPPRGRRSRGRGFFGERARFGRSLYTERFLLQALGRSLYRASARPVHDPPNSMGLGELSTQKGLPT